MLLRKAVLVLYCALSVSLACGPGFGQTEVPAASAQSAVENAEQASAAWMKLMDAGQYAECWKTAAAAIQSAITEEKWTAAMKGVREPLGKVITRSVQSATHTATLPGVPDGDYVVIVYKTRFEHKQSAQETVAMSREPDKVWRGSGFFIK